MLVGKTKEQLQHYKRRTPETSPLDQIVYHSRDDLSVQWELRFQHQYGCLRHEVLKTLDEYLNCKRSPESVLALSCRNIEDIMKAEGFPDFRAPPAIAKFIDTSTLQAIDELTSCDSFEPSPDDF